MKTSYHFLSHYASVVFNSSTEVFQTFSVGAIPTRRSLANARVGLHPKKQTYQISFANMLRSSIGLGRLILNQ
jgi:hypothetical protein